MFQLLCVAIFRVFQHFETYTYRLSANALLKYQYTVLH
jgi:hypothetical protein